MQNRKQALISKPAQLQSKRPSTSISASDKESEKNLSTKTATKSNELNEYFKWTDFKKTIFLAFK